MEGLFGYDQSAEEEKFPEIKKDDIVKEGWLTYQKGADMFASMYVDKKFCVLLKTQIVILKSHEQNSDYSKIQTVIAFNDSTTIEDTDEKAQFKLTSDGQAYLFKDPNNNQGAISWWKDDILDSITNSLASDSALAKLEGSLPFKEIQLEYIMN